MAENLPAFLGQMRHHRREAVDEDVAGLGEGPAQVVGDRRRLDRADRRRERVGEFVDLGDADVEAQPLDLVLDPGERRVGDLADAPGFVAERLRPGRTLGADDALDLADEPPQPLRLLVGALDAGLGPDHVALGRRIGQHEPARRVGAVGLDDLVGVDRVALRLRHLLDRADLDRLAGVDQHRAPLAAVGVDPHLGRRDPLPAPRRGRSRAPPCPG